MNHKRYWNLCLLLALTCCQAFSQTSSDSGALSVDTINRQIEQISSQSELTADQRQNLLTELDSGLNYLRIAEQNEAAAAEFENAVTTEAERSAHFEKLLRDLQNTPDKPDVKGLSPEEIESRIALVKTERLALAERRSEILRETQEAPGRSVAIQERLTALRQLSEESAAIPDLNDGTTEQTVTGLVNQAALRARETEESKLKAELISEPARRQLRSAERAWVSEALDNADRRLTALADAAEAAQKVSSREELAAIDSIARKLQSVSPGLESFAAINRRLAEQLQKAATETDSARKDSANLLNQLEGIEEDRYLMNRRLQVVGHGELIGEVMVSQLENLPDTSSLKVRIKERNDTITIASHALIDVEEELHKFDQGKAFVEDLVPNFQDLDGESRQLLEQLLDQRLTLLLNNQQSLTALVRLLVDNNVSTDNVIDQTEDFSRFLTGNLLWVQNFSFVSPAKLAGQLEVLLDANNWRRLPQDLINGFLRGPLLTLLLVLFIPLLILSHRVRKPYRQLLTTPNSLSGESVRNIFLGLGYSAVMVLPWPLLIYLFGAALALAEPRSPFLDSLAPALQRTALLLLVLLFIRRLVNKIGVGRRYLKWDARMLDALRSELNWAGPVMIIAAFVGNMATRLDVTTSGGPLGSIALLLQAATVIASCMRLLRRDVFREDRMLSAALRIGAALGALCIALQLLGLLFAAKIYVEAMGASALALIIIKLVSDILTRWLLIIRSRLERRAREGNKVQLLESADTDGEAGELRDVASLSEAHTKLLSLARMVAMVMALWLIWSPSLPALALLEEVTLWEISDSSGTVTGLRSITLFDLITGVIILVVTTLIARHLPSLVRLFLLEWVDISPGARYATSILLQYLVVAIGGSMFLTTIGWEWSRVQWLVAALGVGIGFGLQEIVANFISGIIILFERPIRVGDIITAGGAEGIVTEIKPRATIIETFERKEHLIPNKELITGPVINWSLTDNAIRLVIPVGVAYGTDVRQALQLLLDAAAEVRLVLPEPAPVATFEDFGDNSLLLWLRCYAAEDRLRIASDLRVLINDKFEQAGIVISFPQRDIHMDFTQPLRVELNTGESDTVPPGS